MYTAVYFACADDGIGKFDRSMLSQQDLMELFIFGLNKPENICGSLDDPDDVCEWTGVKCNADKEVENFRWLMKRQEGTGTLSLAFLPYTMKKATMVDNALSGTIQLADLPESMEELLLIQNKLSGSFCLDSLPGAMRKLYLSKNNFTGRISLKKLPEELESLVVSENRLTGTAYLSIEK